MVLFSRLKVDIDWYSAISPGVVYLWHVGVGTVDCGPCGP